MAIARFGLVRVFVWTGILAGLMLIPALAADRRPECEQAVSWVAARQGHLPVTLNEIAAYPGIYRRAIFTALPHETRAALWQARIAQALQRDITPMERAMLEEAKGFVTADLYKKTGSPQRERAAEWRTRYRAAFTPAHRKLVTDLGDTDGDFRSVSSTLVQLKQQWNGLGAAFALPTCDCNNGWPDDCDSGLTCHYQGGPVCISTLDGCGPFGWDQCNGYCR